MINGVLIFFLFLGPLVFFHELGHFFFARLFGVRVETFSIGFGPKLFSWKRGDTVYAFSLIPLGGYVKMFGDDPLSEEALSTEEEKVAYTKKSKWARFWIVFGGPLANFIMAFTIYFGLVMGGERVPEPKLGVIKSESEFHSVGLRTGDVLTKINETDITSFDDLNIADSNIKSLTVMRGDKKEVLATDFSITEFHTGLAQSISTLKAPFFTNTKGELFLLQAKGEEIASLEETMSYDVNEYEIIQVDPKKWDKQVFDKGENEVEALDRQSLILSKGSSLKDSLANLGIYPKELMIHNVTLNSAASEAGLKKGDLIVGVENQNIFSFNEFRDTVQELKEEKPIKLSIINGQGLKTIEITPKFTDMNGTKVLLVGIVSGVIAYSNMVDFQAEGFWAGISLAAKRTYNGTIGVVGMFKKLIFGEVSVKNLGGPLAIGQAANDSFDMGASMFFRLMALISINLAVINLFPIPVLDGGHIVFLIFEVFNGGPLSRKKLMVAQQFGMSILLLLIGFAIYNDLTRLFS